MGTFHNIAEGRLSREARVALSLLRKRCPGASYSLEGEEIVVRYNNGGRKQGTEVTRFPANHLLDHPITRRAEMTK